MTRSAKTGRSQSLFKASIFTFHNSKTNCDQFSENFIMKQLQARVTRGPNFKQMPNLHSKLCATKITLIVKAIGLIVQYSSIVYRDHGG